MPKSNHLTDKERIFCLSILNGQNQRNSYITAYQPKTTNIASLDVLANKVVSRPHVQEYLREMRGLQDRAKIYSNINDKQKRIELIWDRIELCKQKNDDTAIARYLDQLAKLNGDYVNINKNIDEKAVTLDDMDITELQNLINNIQ